MFERVKLVAPASVEEIDGKVKELREREALFERVAKEEGTEEEQKFVEALKEKKEKGKRKGSKSGHPETQKEEEFPTI
jgi:hypothetical protein